MNRYFFLPLALCVCLFIGCGSIDEDQPAPQPEVNGHGHVWPLAITGGNVRDGSKDIDSELVSATGIRITFDKPIKGGTVVLRPKDGAPLNWIAQWLVYSVTLSPPAGDRLKNGTEYMLEIIGVEDATGTKYNFEIRFSTKD